MMAMRIKLEMSAVGMGAYSQLHRASLNLYKKVEIFSIFLQSACSGICLLLQ